VSRLIALVVALSPAIFYILDSGVISTLRMVR
jgi:hypothetical protein